MEIFYCKKYIQYTKALHFLKPYSLVPPEHESSQLRIGRAHTHLVTLLKKSLACRFSYDDFLFLASYISLLLNLYFES